MTRSALAAFRIAQVATAEDLHEAAALPAAYATSLPVDLAYQGLDAELASLPEKYAPTHFMQLDLVPDER